MTTFHPGDRVRVKSKEELLSGLMLGPFDDVDASGFTSYERGLWFAPEMFAYCGKEVTLKTHDRDNEHWWFFCEALYSGYGDDHFIFDEEWFDKIDESVDVGDIGGLL